MVMRNVNGYAERNLEKYTEKQLALAKVQQQKCRNSSLSKSYFWKTKEYAMKKNSLVAAREEVKKWLERCLIGPFSKSDDKSRPIDELLPIRPSEFYSCGVLYGHLEDMEILDNKGSDEEENERSVFGIEDNDTSQNKASKTSRTCRYRPPSAVGLSFFVSSDIEIDVILKAARYKNVKQDDKKIKWKRRSLPINRDYEDVISLKPPENDQQLENEYQILSDDDPGEGENEKSDKLHVKWRPYSNSSCEGYIVTISVVNTAVAKKITHDGWEETHLFQLSFECHKQAGDIKPYPRNEIHNMEQEDKEFDLLYSDKTIYAIGHGVSPDWESKAGEIECIKASFIPSLEVPLMKTEVSEIDKETLQLSRLAKTYQDSEKIRQSLYSFTKAYKKWIDDLLPEEEQKKMTQEQSDVAKGMLDRLDKSATRMNAGIKCLGDPVVARAFSFAHKAMIDYMKIRKVENPSWRPFQLGFLLQTLPSLIDENSPDRDLVDLLWFQTGGGKTEAYLVIIAFLVSYRRMLFPETGAGTVVIMRYTVRLLTIQQFQRASILICALELLRRKNPELLGHEPITAGLWVGAGSSPNTFKDAKKILDDALQSDGAGLEKLVVRKCPWCGKRLEIDNNSTKSGFHGHGGDFRFCCTNQHCDFGGSDNPTLPINVVDEYLYKHPPTLLLATVDKFAMFAWKEQTTIFLGNSSFRPPDLIIQDELHLIAGELGTITGVYEASFDTVLKLKDHSPKYIASTATIRNAKEQVKKLFARDVRIFPSPGLNWSDSFFARVDKEKPGRLYIGYYAPNLPRNKSFAPLGAALLLSSSLWNDTDESVQDAWWTLVAYHGSLRGLGITHNLLGSEVRKYLEYYIHFLLDKELDEKLRGTDELSEGFYKFCNAFLKVPINDKKFKERCINSFLNWRRLYKEDGIAELTSNRSAKEIRKYLDNLEINYSDENNHAIAALLCTNMVSVGLDIPRLGLMVVNGQPFTTGEYIQASSRVGRGKVPGIVVAHYYRNHARDMSHFENFRAYHESFYRFVEPTSLTPFSFPARKRALHAALVIVMRHGAGLLGNNMANKINIQDEKIINAKDHLIERCKKASKETSRDASPEQGEKIDRHIDELLHNWNELSGGNGLSQERLQYQSKSKEKKSLLIRPNEKKAKQGDNSSWETLQSMRQVDEECGIVFVAPH
ncbi:MAG: helicase-related protein [Thermodesulfobacteriota bacterium]|nr:helicase-related protein [Thermodesulfobacteriota bacterium]